MKKYFVVLILVILILLTSNTVIANDTKSFSVSNVTDSSYTYYVNVYSAYGGEARVDTSLKDYFTVVLATNGKRDINIEPVWEDPSYKIVLGEQYANLLFILDNKEVKINMRINGVKYIPIGADPNGEDPDYANRDEPAAIEEAYSPLSLTATTLILDKDTIYDINIDNKVKGSSYLWTSSNPKVAKVDKKSGLVTAIKNGNTKITCTITLPDKTQTQLYTDVTVGLDEDTPVLSETDLTLDIGEKFDIDVQNKISKSKYSFKSDDKTVAKVNSSNGIVTALKQGICNITCTITTKDGSVYVLKAVVTVE